MNEFLQQFLLESRELIDQATDGLLSLEKSAHDPERLDAVFRAFHTLKGGAGIVEFPAMERAMHGAEDVLGAARSGKRPFTPDLVGRCLACLDRVLQWLDAVEQTGELPIVAEQQINSVLRALDAAESVTGAGDGSWAAQLQARHADLSAEAASAVRFEPGADCFYQGEDPVARMTSLPGLLALELEPVSPWPPLDSLDPFTSNLVLTALTTATHPQVGAHMQGHSGACEILPIGVESSGIPIRAREILEAQMALLDVGQAESLSGRICSAGRTAANVLLCLGRPEHAGSLSQATEKSLLDNASESLKDAIARALRFESPTPAVAQDSVQRPQARTLRVDTTRIDALVRLTGELTVAKNTVGHVADLARSGNDSVAGALKDHHDQLERLVAELQRSVLQMRVLPLRTVLQRFPRVLREMSASLGKTVQLRLAGEETEADKTIVEMLFEPLLHLVRNALDHGVESSDERATRGKPVVATLTIRALRLADRVVLEVADDGRGINVDRIREVAKARGIVTDEVLRLMTDADVIDLIFAPGFSTAAQVSELSGRGVGMDAVRTAVERVGGRVSIESRPDLGTTVRLSLPFSVMMTHVMTVEAGGQMFGIPLDVVVETVRMPRQALTGIGSAQAIDLRERTVPVIELAQALGTAATTSTDDEVLMVIVAFAGESAAIRVARVGGRLEVILEPLAGLLSGTPGIAGTTLLGDGRVLLVLDVGELVR